MRPEVGGVVSGYFLIAIIGVHFFYRKSLQDSSMEFISSLQEQLSPEALDKWSRWGRLLRFLFPAVTILMSLEHRLRSRQFYWVVLFTLQMTLINVAKIAYQQPRPFWEDTDLFKGECQAQFGGPAGSCMISTTFVVALMLEIADSVSESKKFKVWVGCVLFPFAFAFIVAQGFSRIAVGLHSLEQVVFAWFLGIWLGLTGHFVIRDLVIERANTFIKDEKPCTAREGFLVLVIQGVLLLSQIMAFFEVNAHFEAGEGWDKVLWFRCKTHANRSYHHATIREIGLTFGALGAFWGLFFQQRTFGNMELSLDSGWWFLKLFVRPIAVAICAAPFLAIYQILGLKADSFWACVVLTSVAIFFLYFFLFFLHDRLCVLAGIYERVHGLREVSASGTAVAPDSRSTDREKGGLNENDLSIQSLDKI